MLELKHIFKSYSTTRFNHPVLIDVNLTLPSSGICLIQGISGSGKSTLLNIITQLDCADSGQRITSHDLRISQAPQISCFIDELTVLENLSLVAIKFNTFEKMHQLLKSFDCTELCGLKPYVLSGGERQKLNVLRAFLSNSDLIVLDEPTSSLDSNSKRKICQELSLQATSACLVVVTHDQELVELLRPTQAYLLYNGVLTNTYYSR